MTQHERFNAKVEFIKFMSEARGQVEAAQLQLKAAPALFKDMGQDVEESIRQTRAKSILELATQGQKLKDAQEKGKAADQVNPQEVVNDAFQQVKVPELKESALANIDLPKVIGGARGKVNQIDPGAGGTQVVQQTFGSGANFGPGRNQEEVDAQVAAARAGAGPNTRVNVKTSSDVARFGHPIADIAAAIFGVTYNETSINFEDTSMSEAERAEADRADKESSHRILQGYMAHVVHSEDLAEATRIGKKFADEGFIPEGFINDFLTVPAANVAHQKFMERQQERMTTVAEESFKLDVLEAKRREFQDARDHNRRVEEFGENLERTDRGLSTDFFRAKTEEHGVRSGVRLGRDRLKFDKETQKFAVERFEKTTLPESVQRLAAGEIEMAAAQQIVDTFEERFESQMQNEEESRDLSQEQRKSLKFGRKDADRRTDIMEDQAVADIAMGKKRFELDKKDKADFWEAAKLRRALTQQGLDLSAMDTLLALRRFDQNTHQFNTLSASEEAQMAAIEGRLGMDREQLRETLSRQFRTDEYNKTRDQIMDMYRTSTMNREDATLAINLGVAALNRVIGTQKIYDFQRLTQEEGNWNFGRMMGLQTKFYEDDTPDKIQADVKEFSQTARVGQNNEGRMVLTEASRAELAIMGARIATVMNGFMQLKVEDNNRFLADDSFLTIIPHDEMTMLMEHALGGLDPELLPPPFAQTDDIVHQVRKEAAITKLVNGGAFIRHEEYGVVVDESSPLSAHANRFMAGYYDYRGTYGWGQALKRAGFGGTLPDPPKQTPPDALIQKALNDILSLQGLEGPQGVQQ